MNKVIKSVPFLELTTSEAIAPLLSPQQTKQIREYFHNQGLVVVYLQFCDEAALNVVDEKQLLILGNDRKNYDSAKNPKYKYRYLLGRGLIKQTLGACLGQKPEEIDFLYGAYGKPFIHTNQFLDFNLSHTQNIIVLAVTKLGQIGIDIEFAHRPLEMLEKNICTDFELQELNSLPISLRNPFLVQLWTLKEAFSKSLGLGLNKSFSSFGFKSIASQFHLVPLEKTTISQDKLSFFSESFLEDYQLSLALNHQQIDCFEH
jgi:4'-phosphopantetheinyl transferase